MGEEGVEVTIPVVLSLFAATRNCCSRGWIAPLKPDVISCQASIWFEVRSFIRLRYGCFAWWNRRAFKIFVDVSTVIFYGRI